MPIPPPVDGIPRLSFASLAFGMRIWLSMMLALYAAFWLQLESASSAAVCVGILALPTRGQAAQKAIYRLLGTLIGVVASFIIAGLFNEVRDLFILAFAAWLGFCVFVAGFLDGHRAYGAVLSGYTVAIVAVAQIDAPQSVFDSGVNRGAAIAVGVLALTFVNGVLAAPDVLTGLMDKMEAVRGKVQEFTRHALRGEVRTPTEVAGLYAEIAALHPDITALSAEGLAGRDRAAAARIAVVAMVEQTLAARAVAYSLAGLGAAAGPLSDALTMTLKDNDGQASITWQARFADETWNKGTGTQRRAAAGAALRLLDLADSAAGAVGRMRSGAAGPAGPRLPGYRAAQEAALAGLRTFIAVLLAAVGLSVAGWPEASLGLAFIGATLGIGGTSAKPRDFALGAMLAMPIVVLLAGITQFLVLDGSDSFPALALAMAPPVIGASILLKSGTPRLVGLGFLIIVFFPVLLAPSNPQNYDPQVFLNTSMLAVTAVTGVFILLSCLLPITDVMRRAWLIRSARADFKGLLQHRRRKGSSTGIQPGSAAYRDATRIAQLGTLASCGDEDGESVPAAMRLMELSYALRTFRAAGIDPDGALDLGCAEMQLEVGSLLVAAAQMASWNDAGSRQVA